MPYYSTRSHLSEVDYSSINIALHQIASVNWLFIPPPGCKANKKENFIDVNTGLIFRVGVK